MTRETLKKYLATEAIAADVPASEIDDRVETAIDLGVESFWGSWNWYFKMREATFTVTSAADSYAAPDDFGGLIKIVDRGESRGGDLEYISKEEFDRRFPKPSADSAGIPAVVTCYKNDGSWKLAFYPRPTARSFNLVYEIDKANAVESIPDDFTEGVVIACAKYIPRLASNEGLLLEQRKEIIYRDLRRQNSVHKKPINALGPQGPVGTRLPEWADPNAPIS